MNKVHLVLLTDCIADLMGGAERQIYELARSLDKTRYRVTIASLECVGQAPSHLIEAAGCEFVAFRVKRIYGVDGLRQGLAFRRFLIKENVEILQTYHFSSDIWGPIWARFTPVRYVVSNRRDMGFWRNKAHLQAYRWVNNWVDRIVVVSDSIKHLVHTQEGVSNTKVTTIYNGVHLAEAAEFEAITARQELGLSKNDIVIMHVANLYPVKNHTSLLDAVAGLCEQHTNLTLVLVGEGELRSELQDQAQRLGIRDQVQFLGKREDARRLLSAADICVLPSNSEGMSNSILEYMAAAKPVIASRVGGNPELVSEGKTGFLVDNNGTAELNEALRKLINDPGLRNTMGKEGLKRIHERFTMAAMVASYDNLLSSSISGPTSNTSICHLVSSNGMFGAERVITNLAQHPDLRSYVSTVHNQHNPHHELIDESQRLGLNTVSFHSRRRIDFRTAFQIRRFLRQHNIELLHSHNYKADVLAFLATRFSQTHWVATNHTWHGLDKKLRLYEKLDAFLLRFARHVTAVSPEIRSELLARGVSADKTSVIDNGINIEQFALGHNTYNLKQELGIRPGEPVVAMIGRLSPEKCHASLLNAAPHVLQHHPNTRFLIIGDGPLNRQLQAQAKKMDLEESFVFAGIRDDMPAIYAICDLLVNASTIEGLPMTILEAMAASLPVITLDGKGNRDLIEEGKNGYMIYEQDTEKFADRIIKLWEDKQKMQEISAYANKFAKQYDIVNYVDKLVQIYQNAINSK